MWVVRTVDECIHVYMYASIYSSVDVNLWVHVWVTTDSTGFLGWASGAQS